MWWDTLFCTDEGKYVLIYNLFSLSLVDGHHLWETDAKVLREASKSVSDLYDSCYCDKFPFALLD